MSALRKHASSFASGLVGAVVGATLLGGVAYAANGGSFLLGKSNAESTTATLTNSNAKVATGAALRLVTHSATYPPFTTNAKGLVANLYAARAASADKLGTLTATSIVAAGQGHYALFSPTGTVSRSSAGISATHPSPGLYCVSVVGVSPAAVSAVVSPDYDTDFTNATNHTFTTAEVDSYLGVADGCSVSQFEIHTFTMDVSATPGTVTPTDVGFTFTIAK